MAVDSASCMQLQLPLPTSSAFAALLAVAMAGVTATGCGATAPLAAQDATTPGGHLHANVVVEVGEPDATVAMAPAPLIMSAGPTNLFVAEAGARCPAEMALVGGRVCIDRWENSLVEITDGSTGGGQAGVAAWSPFEPVDHVSATFRAVSRPGVSPQGYISGKQAERACRSAGKRLCTTTEWEAGCRGPQRWQFPYGNTRVDGACNDDVRQKHPVVEAAKMLNIPSDRMWFDGMNLAIVNQLPDTIELTGTRETCKSPDGLYDMVGNLHEWVADADGTFRGGYYMDTTKNGDGCSYRTTAHDFDYHDYSTGFRCCADPESIE
ncbi:MAG: SUMF1/EgtB/PvdO family nonheme iron enzyme [Polyangiaceae bacterium]